MSLCGVLKNILLVIASVLIWGTVVSGLQVLGYTIATLGLIYYGVGYEGIQTYYAVSQTYARKLWEGEDVGVGTAPPKSWARKAVVAGFFLVIFFMLMVGLGMGTEPGREFVGHFMGTGVRGEGSA
jgi:hypothetical protein